MSNRHICMSNRHIQRIFNALDSETVEISRLLTLDRVFFDLSALF